MAHKLYSKALKPFEGQINNPLLLDSLNGLLKYLGKRKLNLFAWDEKRLAITLTLTIELPPLGNAGDIDVRESEGIIIVINPEAYPTVSPLIFPDRVDFPKNSLAHLYIAQADRPPAFCLIRGNITEWYANKQLKDIVIRAKNWLRDAATGELSLNGSQFDPLRLEGYRGTNIYSYDQIAQIVIKNQSFSEDGDFAFALFEKAPEEEGDYPSYKLETIITANAQKEAADKFIEGLDVILEKKSFKVRAYHYGYVVWSKTADTFSQYNVSLPSDWQAFQAFCTEYGIDVSSLEEHITSHALHLLGKIPVIIALKRPKEVIGFSANIEFINFNIEYKKENAENGKIFPSTPVHFQAHNEPLTFEKARKISNSASSIKNTAIIGCGALGSKVTMHFARSGMTDFMLFDPDKISPHNLVRHSLLADYEGTNKAVALSNAIKSIFRYDTSQTTLPIPRSGESLLSGDLKSGLKHIERIFDFTASESFFHSIVNSKDLSKIKVSRGTISDHGNLGILFLEGENRNPRIDDLQAMLYASYKQHPFVSDWLKREFQSQNEETIVTVGVGCNSETIILADEVISIHSAVFARVLKHNSEANTDRKGRIILSQVAIESESDISSKSISVGPMVVFSAINNPTWEIRYNPSCIRIMKSLMGLNMPNETGGVLIGSINNKTKTIHVTEIIPAPSDSTANAGCFFRGIQGLPEAVKEINEKTGGLLGYVGEWHTHPFGPESMSNIDAGTVRRFRKEFDQLENPLPVFLTILTPENLLTYVY